MKIKLLQCILLLLASGLKAQIPNLVEKSELFKVATDTKAKPVDSYTAKRLFPTWKADDKEKFYELLYSKNSDNEFYFVNNAAVQFNNDGSTIQAEIVSAFLGPSRLTFGTAVTNATDNDEEPGTEPAIGMLAEDEGNTEVARTEAFQRLMSNAGNVYMMAELPMLYLKTKTSMAYAFLFGRGAIDISDFSDDVDTSTGNGSFGCNVYASLRTDQNEFNFFLNTSTAWYMGSDQFYQRLGITNNKAFSFGQLTLGVTVKSRMRFSFTTNTFGSEASLRSGTVVFGVQVLSGMFE